MNAAKRVGSMKITHFNSSSNIDIKTIKKVGNIEILKTIGHGSFGRVYLGYERETQKFYAVKRASYKDLNHMVNGVGQLEREIRMLQTFNHNNILKLYSVYQSLEKPYVYMIMEYADCGCLEDKMDGSPSPYKFEDILSIIKQVAGALTYMHSMGIVHQDIKPSNILLCSDGRILLSDFGIGHRFQSAAMVVGSPAYQAPEVLDDYEDEDFDSESEAEVYSEGPIKEDVWALGVTFYQLLFSNIPWVGENLYEIVHLIKTTPLVIPEGTSPEVSDLIKLMLNKDPIQRISMKELTQHPLIASANDRVQNPPPPYKNDLPLIIDMKEINCKQIMPGEPLVPPDYLARGFGPTPGRIRSSPLYQLSNPDLIYND